MLTIRQFVVFATASVALYGQGVNPANWKTWVIPSGVEHGVAPPPDAAATRGELNWLREAMAGSAGMDSQIRYWDSGPPSFQWMEMIANRQSAGQSVGAHFPRAYAYVSMAVYDATVAAWNAKMAYQRPRPGETDAGIRARVPMPHGPSYPSDYAATAAAAATVMSYLVPAEAEHFHAMAEQAGKSRLYAGVEYPSDYFAGMELGRRVAEQVIAKARMDGSDAVWAGAVPSGPCRWTGANPGNAARAYALLGAVGYDAFIASQDGKFAYWYPRPAQLDPSLVPLFPAPNFPSYPSNHSTFSTARAEVLAYLFPERAEAIRAMGKEAGDSRIWAGIHFEMDNRAGVQLGMDVARKFIEWAENDGSR